MIGSNGLKRWGQLTRCRQIQLHARGIGCLTLTPELFVGHRLQQAGMVYKCTAEPWVFKLLALALAAFSALIVWSEATIGFGRDLSPFSHVRMPDLLCFLHHLPCLAAHQTSH